MKKVQINYKIDEQKHENILFKFPKIIKNKQSFFRIYIYKINKIRF